MAKHPTLALLLSACVPLLTCVSTGCGARSGLNEPPKVVAGSTPESTFSVARDALIEGNAEKMFDCYTQNKKNQEGGPEVFKRNFESKRPQLLALFTGSRVTFVAVEKEQATAVVLWGNGERWPPVSFVLERGVWKIEK